MALSLPLATIDEIGSLLDQDSEGLMFAWFDVATGEIVVSVSMYGLDDGDEEDVGAGGRTLPAWQLEDRERVRTALADPERYREIPMGRDHGQPGKLARFARSLADPRLAEAVWAATRGRGAFRRVKDLLHRRDKLELWNVFDTAEQRASAREWLRSEGVEWTEV